MQTCSKCKAPIVAHFWISDGEVYCSPGCERGGKMQFEKTLRAAREAHKRYLERQ